MICNKRILLGKLNKKIRGFPEEKVLRFRTELSGEVAKNHF